MGQVTISLPDDLERQLRRYAENNGYATVSSLANEAIRDKLTGTGKPDYWTRVGLVLQMQILRGIEGLERGKPIGWDEDWSFKSGHDALAEGYVGDYQSAFEFVYKDEMSPSESHYVIDVLAMFDDLQHSAKELKDDELQKLTVFPGWDGNHEGKRLGFTRYLVGNRRFDFIKSMFPDFNSHSMTPDYPAMLERYNAVRTAHSDRSVPLTAKEIHEIRGR
jgi:uncharacterized protein YfbU (UPF0304 family)